jgi:WD40 repeat protein
MQEFLIVLSALSSALDGSMILWSIPDGEIIRRFTGHTRSVRAGIFSSDGIYALSASSDMTLRLWEVSSGNELCRWTTDAPLLCCALTSNAQRALAGDSAGGFHFLDIKWGKQQSSPSETGGARRRGWAPFKWFHS